MSITSLPFNCPETDTLASFKNARYWLCHLRFGHEKRRQGYAVRWVFMRIHFAVGTAHLEGAAPDKNRLKRAASKYHHFAYSVISLSTVSLPKVQHWTARCPNTSRQKHGRSLRELRVQRHGPLLPIAGLLPCCRRSSQRLLCRGHSQLMRDSPQGIKQRLLSIF